MGTDVLLLRGRDPASPTPPSALCRRAIVRAAIDGNAPNTKTSLGRNKIPKPRFDKPVTFEPNNNAEL